jgi:hypothetical protein
MSLIKRGDNFLFQYTLADGREDRFIQVNLYDTADDSLIGSYDAPFLQDGIYQNKSISALTIGYFIARATVYKDALFTNRDNKYSLISETIRVENTAEQVSDLAETINENIDDSDGRIT